MIKNKFILILFCLGFLSSTYAQVEEGLIQTQMPKEKVFIHTNNTLLLTGEKLLYKFYSLESETNKLSDFSKVGWVQLINNKKEVVFQHKVKLKKGQGFADFFIPAN